MKCWHCSRELEEPARIPFKAVCDHCSAYLHCCKNCKNYKPGMPNDCLVPGTELIADREAANYCEEFVLQKGSTGTKKDVSQVEKRLFGDDKPQKKKDFDSLFNS